MSITTKEEKVFLGAYWRERRITGKQFIRQSYDFLVRLREFSPLFQRHCVALVEGSETVPAAVPRDYEAFERLMIKTVPHPEHAYTNPDPGNNAFTLDSTITAGFRITFGGDHGNVQPTAPTISISAGAYGGEYSRTNSVLIKIPPDCREFWENEQKTKRLMEVVVASWQPTFATLSSLELKRALDPNRTAKFPFGPIVYFADKSTTNTIKGTGKVEFCAYGGVFVEIECSYPWAVSVDCFKSCYTQLRDAGLLEW